MNMKDVVKSLEGMADNLESSFQIDDETAKQIIAVWGNPDKVAAAIKQWFESRDFMGAPFMLLLTPTERSSMLDCVPVVISRSKSAMDFIYKIPRILLDNSFS